MYKAIYNTIFRKVIIKYKNVLHKYVYILNSWTFNTEKKTYGNLALWINIEWLAKWLEQQHEKNIYKNSMHFYFLISQPTFLDNLLSTAFCQFWQAKKKKNVTDYSG